MCGILMSGRCLPRAVVQAGGRGVCRGLIRKKKNMERLIVRGSFSRIHLRFDLQVPVGQSSTCSALNVCGAVGTGGVHQRAGSL